ncbi:DUF6263 family protein [Clostridium aestuarii]|uniref:DUF6263 family protein n=1 Tax=Clostridium aestuarii TaxID=338193 RepID=A0ABT4D3T4_9CLOT|nr:DUF6263 family protein [Clostridium aestuarii]MCY6484855.1 DUF6263 family protein [Clostridium aestuarii]
MKNKISRYCALILIVVIFMFTGCIEEKVQFSLKLKKGDMYKIEMNTDEKITQTIKGQKTEVNSKMKSVYSCYVMNVDENKNSEIRMTLDMINLKNMSNNGKTIEYNSETQIINNENMDKVSKIYAAIIGESFTMKIGEDGKVKEIMDIDNIIGNVFKQLNIKDSKEKDEIQAIILEQFSEDAITKKTEDITSVYPEEPVKVGEEWVQKDEIKGEFALESENKYTLKERKDKTAEVNVDAKVKTKKHAEPMIVGNIKINYDLTGHKKGVINIDEETGIPKHIEMEHKYGGEMKLASQDPNIGAQTFPINVEGKSRIVVTKN